MKNGLNYNEGSLDNYFKEINKFKQLSLDEEKQLSLRVKQGDLDARNKLINSNLKLVIYIAKKYQGKGLSFPDLISEGTIGLINAVDRYDIFFDSKFSTYASYWIKQSLIKSIFDKGNPIRFPTYIHNQLYYLNKNITLYEELYSKNLVNFLKKTNISYKTLEELSRLPICDSLDNLLEDGTSFNEVISDNSIDIEKNVFERDLLDNLQIFLDTKFTKREKYIIESYFGLNKNNRLTLEGIGNNLGLSKERVRQIKKEVQARLKLLLQDFYDNEPARI